MLLLITISLSDDIRVDTRRILRVEQTYFIVNTNKWIRPTFVKQEQLTVQCTRVHPWCFAAFLLLNLLFFPPLLFRSLYRRLDSGYLLDIFKLQSWLNLRFSYLSERKSTFLVDMSESNILKFHYLLELIFSYTSCSFLYFFIITSKTLSDIFIAGKYKYITNYLLRYPFPFIEIVKQQYIQDNTTVYYTNIIYLRLLVIQ